MGFALPCADRGHSWLGSSIGNFDRSSGAAFLKRIADEALQPGDTILLGIDGCGDKDSIELAYNDRSGVTRDFILNGVQRAADLVGSQDLGAASFDYVNRFNAELGAHEAFVRVRKDITLPSPLTGGGPVELKKGELVAIEKCGARFTCRS
jgi:uncharacterized SAM-dependent methyltransferase